MREPGKTIDHPLTERFSREFGRSPAVTAYAPGRVEILGNHTDYNDGFVLSAAINLGTYFLAAPSSDNTCHLIASDIQEQTRFPINDLTPSSGPLWANFVKGVVAHFPEKQAFSKGFVALFGSNIPMGAGLSSSAALEIAAGLALSSLYEVSIDKLELARIGQSAEHKFVGAKCGLLDQISSLFGMQDALILTDFRSLAIENVAMGHDACFLMCNTRVKHSLVESEYNERRAQCEEAARLFNTKLDRDVAALRDVEWNDWETFSPDMPADIAHRSAHVIGENARVLKGKTYLQQGNLAAFGKLMFDSHASSVTHFENSCPELDFLVEKAKELPGIMGARLSGGGFGGSMVALIHPGNAKEVTQALTVAYEEEYGTPCETCLIIPSPGAKIL